MYACNFGKTDSAKMLLDHGAVIDHCDKVKDLEHVYTYKQYNLSCDLTLLRLDTQLLWMLLEMAIVRL